VSARRRRRGEHGQVMIIFAFALIVLLGMMAIALDGTRRRTPAV
jgi:Flp pilus assembly protein TadG